MAQFQFNDENQGLKQKNSNSGRGFAGRLIKWGLAKNEQQANLYLVALAFIGIAITIYNITQIL
jgi:hypothetical protein